MLSLPKGLRYFLQNDPKALNTALRIFLQVILASRQAHCPIAVGLDRKLVQLAACAAAHISAASPLWREPEHPRAFSYLRRRWRV